MRNRYLVEKDDSIFDEGSHIVYVTTIVLNCKYKNLHLANVFFFVKGRKLVYRHNFTITRPISVYHRSRSSVQRIIFEKTG